MPLIDFCSMPVVSATPNASVSEIADLMYRHNVGCVVITEENKPVGIVTDRDLTLRALRMEKDPKNTRIREVMTPNPVVFPMDIELYDAMKQISDQEFRRVPVVNGDGTLAGLISMDDLFRLQADQMLYFSMVLEKQSAQL